MRTTQPPANLGTVIVVCGPVVVTTPRPQLRPTNVTYRLGYMVSKVVVLFLSYYSDLQISYTNGIEKLYETEIHFRYS